MSENRPAFGWLLLGLCWGTLIGHAVAVHLMSPQGHMEYLQRWGYALIVGAILGVGSGAVIDATAERSSTWLDWVAFVVFTVVYLFFSLPMVNAARE